LMAIRNVASKALILPLTVSGLVTCANAAGWLTTTYAEVAGAGLAWQTSATGAGVVVAGDGVAVGMGLAVGVGLAVGAGVFVVEPQAVMVSPAKTTSVKYFNRTGPPSALQLSPPDGPCGPRRSMRELTNSQPSGRVPSDYRGPSCPLRALLLSRWPSLVA
jgi:hypothetical protein